MIDLLDEWIPFIKGSEITDDPLSPISNYGKKILKEKDLNYFIVKEKLLIETLWNKLIYDKYKDNVVINKKELRENIIIEFNNKKRKIFL